MRSEHHDLISPVGARDLSDRVVLLVSVGPVVLYIDLELHRCLLLQQACHAIPLLNRQRQLWYRSLGLALAICTTTLHEDSSSARGSATAVDHRQRLFVSKELIQIPLKLLASLLLLRTKRRPLAWQFVIPDVCQRLFRVALVWRFHNGLHVHQLTEDRNLPGQLALVLFKILLGPDVGANAIAVNCTVGSGSPRLRISDNRLRIRRQHAHIDILIPPAASERSPGFEVSIDQTEFR